MDKVDKNQGAANIHEVNSIFRFSVFDIIYI